MKKRFCYFMLSVITTVCFLSCSNEDSEQLLFSSEFENSDIATKAVEKDSVVVEYFTNTLMYKDEKYSYQCKSVNDSIIVLDEKVSKLLVKIFDNQNSVSLNIKDGVTEYFDSQEDFYDKYGIKLLDSVDDLQKSTRDKHDDTKAYAILYDDSGFHDTNLELDIRNEYDSFNIPYMKDKGLNDKVSSLKVQYYYPDVNYCAILTVWEDSSYNNQDNNKTKHRTNFIATHENSTPEWGKLKNVQCFNAHDSWNDRISSLTFRIGSITSIPGEY